MSIRLRFLLALVPMILILFGLLTYFSFKASEKAVLEEIGRDAFNLATSYAGEFDVFTQTSKGVAEGMASALNAVPKLEDGFIRNLIKKNLEENPAIYGSTISLQPGATTLGLYAPYFCRGADNKLKYESLAKPSYNYLKWDWFKEPIKTGRGSWTEPYFDRGGGNTLMTTYSAPIYRNKKIIGVATVDITLDDFVKRVQSLKVGNTGYAYIVSRQGYFIAHPDKSLLSTESIWANKEVFKDPNLAKLIELIKAGKPEAAELFNPFTKKESWFITMPIRSTGWMLVIVYPLNEVLSPLIRLRLVVGIISAVIVVLLLLIILWLSSQAASPIEKLVKHTERYATGDFEGRLDDKKGLKEIRKLSNAFNVMGEAIAQKIRELRETQKEIVHRLGRAAEFRDADTGMHIKRMSHYCQLLCKAYGLNDEDSDLLLYASPMHDIGKIGIPDSILLKKGKLDPDEFETIKKHTVIGKDILSGSESKLLEMAKVIANPHHEKWDGSGYPLGLKREEIPLVGRIAAICDVFDSLTSERPYKKSWPVEEAVAEIEKKSGKNFDPQLVELFKKNLPEILKLKEDFKEEQ